MTILDIIHGIIIHGVIIHGIIIPRIPIFTEFIRIHKEIKHRYPINNPINNQKYLELQIYISFYEQMLHMLHVVQ